MNEGMCDLTMTKEYDNYKSAREAFFRSDGMMLLSDFKRIAYSCYLFFGNYHDLERYHSRITTPPGNVALTVAFFREEEKDKYLKELYRLLHNYCTAIKTLVDHTRNVHKELLEKRGVRNEYEAKVKEMFIDSVESQFLQHLRNYLLHYDPFSVQYRIQWKDGICSTPIYLDKGLLLRWKKWPRPVREYIASQDQGISLWHAAEGYYKLIHEFYDWLYARHQKWFSKELEEMDQLFDQALKYGRRNENRTIRYRNKGPVTIGNLSYSYLSSTPLILSTKGEHLIIRSSSLRAFGLAQDLGFASAPYRNRYGK